MTKDRLFPLQPDFEDAGRRWFCPPCATVAGFLDWFPRVRDAIDLVYVDFPRPRGPVAELLGDDHPGCPLLVMSEDARDVPEVKVLDGRRCLDDPQTITRYLAERHGAPAPHC
ncbi:DUF3088 family protein [Caulobacter sp. 17J65-9]|uniref:DUF3088 family protein n=1 Tax=Caulobacter sp. 17J65-9 TaxID=2709382 RepID=UPI0013CCD2C0|nr:DUF3088 family protein [Caulobacter sp. 17J65-9]NEX94365.1 DUF3088 domain-containing protein [Caulobacter sp. 17J65-9]